MTAFFALAYLLKTSVQHLSHSPCAIFGLVLNRAFKMIRPKFRARPRSMRKLTGRLTESNQGVRVVKGYHAEKREEEVFSLGRAAGCLQQTVSETLTATSLISLSATSLMGLVSAAIMFMGQRHILARHDAPPVRFSPALF